MYNSMSVQLLSWKYEAEYCTIVTSGPWKTLPTTEMGAYLKAEFLEVELDDEASVQVPAAPNTEFIPMPNIKGLDKCGDLVDILFASIEKVGADKEYVNQAKAVSELTGNVVGVVKLQLDALTLATNLHRNR